MAPDDKASPTRQPAADFLPSAAAALEAIDAAVHSVHGADAGGPGNPAAGPEQALASLMLLREVREQLAGWETGLIETARRAGASWAELAPPLGVASRQAAERRYLRLRPGPAGSTGEQRVQATRNRRAADRTVDAWARTHAAELRRLAGQITALTDLPAAFGTAVSRLDTALAADDAAAILTPLAATRAHLKTDHPDLAARVDALTQHADHLRHANDDGRTA
jgi:hypothetical protein